MGWKEKGLALSMVLYFAMMTVVFVGLFATEEEECPRCLGTDMDGVSDAYITFGILERVCPSCDGGWQTRDVFGWVVNRVDRALR